MATDKLTATVTCPACQQPLAIPSTARHTGCGQAEVTFDTSAVHAHLATHSEGQPMIEPADRREAICDWLRSNGIDPDHVPVDAALTIESNAGQRVIRCDVFVTDADGRHVLDERRANIAIETRTVPLIVEPPNWWQPHVKPTREQLAESLRAVYRERAYLVAYLTTLHPSHIQDDPADPDWPIVFVNLPCGQLTWHIAKADLDLFAHVRTDLVETWDGHTTEEKYQRLADYTALRAR